MKIFSPAAMAAIKKREAIVGGALEILSSPPIRLWSGYGVLTFDGRSFDPVGDHALAQVSGGSLGGAAQNVTLTLSGIDDEALALLDVSEVMQAPAVLWRLIFSGDGNSLLDAHVYQRGSLDTLPVEDIVGGTSTIRAIIETAARGLGRKGGRMRSDADQRLIKPNDGFFKHVAYAAEKQLYWGGQRPATAGSALGGVPAGGYGGGSSDLAKGVFGRDIG